LRLLVVQADGLGRAAEATDNGVVRGRWEAVVLGAVLGAVVACTAGAHPAQPGKQPDMRLLPEHRAGTNGELGAHGCHPASPLSLFGSLPQVEGTGHGASLWGLLMFARPLPARVGDQEKIVWRMTGEGLPVFTAIGPSRAAHRPEWGPAAHDSSTWNKPGAEWGAGYIFTAPGCWDLHAVRGKATADVWIRVFPRLPPR
jgi:hypothetical protein